MVTQAVMPDIPVRLERYRSRFLELRQLSLSEFARHLAATFTADELAELRCCGILVDGSEVHLTTGGMGYLEDLFRDYENARSRERRVGMSEA